MNCAVKFVSLLFCFVAVYSVPVPKNDPNYRLTTDLQPSNYKLNIKISDDLSTATTFDGDVEITFKVAKVPTNPKEIRLHSEVTIKTVGLKKKGEVDFATIDPPEPAVNGIIKVQAPADLVLNDEHVLKITYTGTFNDATMDGFYKSQYKEGNAVKYMASTQFESTSARKALPCFDEPRLKATFDVTIDAPDKYVTVLSNTEISSSKKTATRAAITFKTTPPMSTYLLAFAVAEFSCVDGSPVDTDVKTRVCARTITGAGSQFARDIGTAAIAAIEGYTGIPYKTGGPGKLDQLAVPDFAAGAMENWGLVTYREAALLSDDAQTSEVYKQKIATVITHELGHQWFGDYVTLQWWSDVFLNEGFATYLEYHAADKIPALSTWELPSQFIVDEVQTALDYDASATALPLQSDVDKPEDISNRFDSISYNKGGSILRMAETILTTDKFKTGLKHYLEQKAHGSALADDLWTLVAEGQDLAALLPTDKSLKDVMDNWTKKGGFPIVKVTSDGDGVKITQTSVRENDNTKWYVPLSYYTDKSTSIDPKPMAWITPDDTEKAIADVLKDASWFILNTKQSAYYRVDYSDDLWTKINTALADSEQPIDPLNKAQIVDDVFYFSKSEKRDYSKVFETIAFLQNEKSYYPWNAAFRGFSHIFNNIDDANLKTSVKNYISALVNTFYKDVDGDQTAHVKALSHALVKDWACKVGKSECVEEAKTKFNAYIDATDNTIKPEDRSFVYCYGLLNSADAQATWTKLWNKYVATPIPSEQNIMLKALGCVDNADVLEGYLEKTIIKTDAPIRRQDLNTAYTAIQSSTPAGITATINFLNTKYAEIVAYAGDTSVVKSLISSVSSRFTNQAQMTELKKLNDLAGVADDVKTALTEAETKVTTHLQHVNKVQSQLSGYFNQGGGDPDGAVSITVSTTLLTTALVLLYQLI